MTTDSTNSTEGTVERRDGSYVLRFERRLRHPIEKVWAALTEPGELVGWLAEAEVELVEGGRVNLRWLNTDEEGNTAAAEGTITRLQAPRVLEYDTDIHGLLRWELSEDGDGCRLRLTNATPAPDEYLTEVLAGWHIHLDHLVDALGGHPVDWPAWSPDYRARATGASWDDYQDRYKALQP
jgi:uncharacterized protein YndB with AHSA1/START domain